MHSTARWSLALIMSVSSWGLAYAQTPPQPVFPVIKNYGPAFPLPQAAEQPRQTQNIKTLFDITKAAKSPDKVLPGLDHVARYLNVYAQAGASPNNMHIVVVLHGKATPAALNDDAYNKYTNTTGGNPNLNLIRQLKNAGVTLYVCGQALNDYKFDATQVTPEITEALSALTVVTNYQEQHYVYFPE